MSYLLIAVHLSVENQTQRRRQTETDRQAEIERQTGGVCLSVLPPDCCPSVCREPEEKRDRQAEKQTDRQR